MAFSDPQSITIGGTTYSCARTITDPRRAVYVDGTNTVRLTPSQVQNGRLSHVVTLGQSKIAADPISAVNKQLNASWQLSMIRPLVGFSTAEMISGLTGLVTWLSATSYANGTKLVDGQS
jgi:hypothetical protein